MKIVVLGATGATGQCVVSQALDVGHDVTTVVRTPAKLTITHDKLSVVKGDVFSDSSLQPLFEGHDAVISCLGLNSGGWNAEVTFYSESIKAIVTAMKAANVKRLLVVSSWGTTSDAPFSLKYIFKPLFLKKNLGNMGDMETYIQQECQGEDSINYTVVKPPILGKSNPTNKVIKAQEGQRLKPSRYTTLNRGDVARFMLTCLEENKEWDRKLVAIGL